MTRRIVRRPGRRVPAVLETCLRTTIAPIFLWKRRICQVRVQACGPNCTQRSHFCRPQVLLGRTAISFRDCGPLQASPAFSGVVPDFCGSAKAFCVTSGIRTFRQRPFSFSPVAAVSDAPAGVCRSSFRDIQGGQSLSPGADAPLAKGSGVTCRPVRWLIDSEPWLL